jgi:hypothetical protein
MIPLLSAPTTPYLLCAVNPIHRQHLVGREVIVRNGRRGYVSNYYTNENRVRVIIDVGLWFLYAESPTMDELAAYNGWLKAAS